MILRSGQLEELCRLIYQGKSNRQAAEILGMSSRTVDRFVKTPEFLLPYQEIKSRLRSEVYDAVRDRTKDVMMAALEAKIDILNTTKKEGLKNLVASQLLEFGLESFRGEGAGELSQELQKVWERVKKTKTPEGETVTETLRITGNQSRTDDSAPSSVESWPDSGSGGMGGEIGPEKAQGGS